MQKYTFLGELASDNHTFLGELLSECYTFLWELAKVDPDEPQKKVASQLRDATFSI